MAEVAEAFVTNDLGTGPPGTTVGVMASQDSQNWYGVLGLVFGGFVVLPSFYTEVSTFTKAGKVGDEIIAETNEWWARRQ